ncbi:MAG: isocitrate/isopropylmalate family dehydrogenase, partial [Longimicrobiales bacterium]|nr:isocitrate/isopropylmalate family dehydrogenase [Longimicrobiales bacterium]
GGLWRRVFAEVASEHPDIEADAMYVDAMAMDLVRRPERYEVLVASNLFGDIISDLAAEITGGIGMAPSANIHPGRHALFEPVHGSAPDIAGQGKANPIGAIRCVALMMDHFGLQKAGERIEAAAVASFMAGQTTPDLGGSLSTAETTTAIIDHLRSAYSASA